MNRRKVLGLGSLVLLNSACNHESSDNAKSKAAALVLNDDQRKRARALGLTLLLTNKRFRQDFAADANQVDTTKVTYGSDPASSLRRFNNPTDKPVYAAMMATYKASSSQMESDLDNLGKLMVNFAQAAGLTNYSPPDCPCGAGDTPDCTIVDLLLN